MKVNIHETLEEAAPELPSDRSTGLVLAAAAAVGATIWWKAMPVAAASGLGVAALLAVVALAAPATLRPLNVAWMALGQLLGRIVNPIVMLALFIVAVIPFGLAMQLRRDPLRRRPTSADETYWIVPEIEFGPRDMTRQF